MPATAAVDAKSNSSEQKRAKKDNLKLKKLTSKDAKILFGDQAKGSGPSSLLTKRPRLMSNQNDKELKKFAIE